MHQDLVALVVALAGMVAQALVVPLVRREKLVRRETSVAQDPKESLDPLVPQVRKTARQVSATRKKWFAAAAAPRRNAPLTRCQFAGWPVEAKLPL